MSGTDIHEAEYRFESIGQMLATESVAIGFGLATLQPGEAREQLTARADAALLAAKEMRRG